MPDVIPLESLRRGPTACLFEGGDRIPVSMFVTAYPERGQGPDLHVHPYPETFLLLEGHGRWTAGDDVVELEAEQMLVVPPRTPHGFRNTGDAPLLVVSVHEAGKIEQEWLGREPA